jgi:hypothetical protein
MISLVLIFAAAEVAGSGCIGDFHQGGKPGTDDIVLICEHYEVFEQKGVPIDFGKLTVHVNARAFENCNWGTIDVSDDGDLFETQIVVTCPGEPKE